MPIWIFYFLKNQNDNCTADIFDIVSIIHCSDLEYVCFRVFFKKNEEHRPRWKSISCLGGSTEPTHHRYLATFYSAERDKNSYIIDGWIWRHLERVLGTHPNSDKVIFSTFQNVTPKISRSSWLICRSQSFVAQIFFWKKTLKLTYIYRHHKPRLRRNKESTLHNLSWNPFLIQKICFFQN